MDKYIGKVILLYLPNNKRPRYRWIVRKRDDGRYIVRAPKIGTLRKDINLRKDKDFNKETLLPKNSKIYEYQNEISKKSKKNKTKNIFFDFFKFFK